MRGYTSAIFLTSIFLMLGCQSEMREIVSERNAAIVDKEFILGNAVRTTLSGEKVQWVEGDRVSVFDKEGNRCFLVSMPWGDPIISGKALNQQTYCFLYPYDADAKYDGSRLYAMLPELQRPVIGGFDPGADVICAVASGLNVDMKNVCGLLRFSLSKSDVKEISICSIGGEKFVGNAEISVSEEGVPEVKSISSNKLKVLPSSGETFMPGTYSLCVAPCSLASGVEVRLLKADGSLMSKTVYGAVSVRRSGVAILGEALDAGTLTPVTTDTEGLAVNSVHPRLFASDAEFREYKRVVLSQKSLPLSLMHNEVMASAVRITDRNTIFSNALDKSQKRMLEMARDVFGRVFFCAYAYRFTGEKRFLDRAIDILGQICDFPNWNKENHYLDTSTLTHAASVGYDWLYYDLPEDLRKKLEAKVFEYSLGTCLTDAAGYINPNSGWNTTITSGLILGGIAFYDVNPKLCNELLRTAIPSNYNGLRKLLGTDGSDHMGTMYWRNFIQMEMLSVSALKSLYMTDFGTSDYEGYRNTAYWYLHLVGNTGRTFAFGDNNESVDTVPGMYYFSVLFDQPSLPYFEVELAKKGQVLIGCGRTADGTAVNARTYPLTLLWASKYVEGSCKLPDEKVYLAGDGVIPIMVTRSGWGKDDVYLALKGGQANLQHSHMDAGSICYESDGERWINDPVQDSYDEIEKAIQDTHSGDLWDRTDGSARYMCFRINCRQHSTFCVNDKDHLANGNARITRIFDDPDACGGTVDLTSTMKGEVASASRTALMKDDSYLEIRDAVTALSGKSALVRWNICTAAVPEITKDGILLTIGEKKKLLTASSAYPLEYRIFTSDPSKVDHPSPFCYAEEIREGEYFCGFIVTIPAGKSDTITTTIR